MPKKRQIYRANTTYVKQALVYWDKTNKCWKFLDGRKVKGIVINFHSIELEDNNAAN